MKLLAEEPRMEDEKVEVELGDDAAFWRWRTEWALETSARLLKHGASDAALKWEEHAYECRSKWKLAVHRQGELAP